MEVGEELREREVLRYLLQEPERLAEVKRGVTASDFLHADTAMFMFPSVRTFLTNEHCHRQPTAVTACTSSKLGGLFPLLSCSFAEAKIAEDRGKTFPFGE